MVVFGKKKEKIFHTSLSFSKTYSVFYGVSLILFDQVRGKSRYLCLGDWSQCLGEVFMIK
jgi:hypothetical protein